ncbi:MAG: N-acetyl-gamma-glutamyl-phosphate reductase [Treponema sp.]|nr:N-acetyl-gamma-glutamyl-phosphate reductase [Treponema sp.]
MAKFRVFVDGQEGTTGLEINGRLLKRNDVEILEIDQAKRKDPDERKKFLNSANVVFLCLPDEAAKESVSLIDNRNVKVIDCSTAHRTDDSWAYGIPELSGVYRKKIQSSKRVSNPGCFATGFNMLMYPLVSESIVPSDYPVSCHAVTGYSGGGKKLIGIYESPENKQKLESPCFYSLNLHHKHLPEMKKHSGLLNYPIFTPILGNYYRGMIVAVPLCTDLFQKKITADQAASFYSDYYRDQKFVKVFPANIQDEFEWGYMNAQSCNFTNNIEILIFGDGKQILAAARLDNLGKGASGAAIQNMNIMLGLDESYSLV